MRSFLVIATLFIAHITVSSHAFAAPDYQMKFDEERGLYIVSFVDKSGLKRDFQVSLPQKGMSSRRYAAVLLLHGGKGNADRIREQTNFVSYAKDYKFVAVFPETGDSSPWEDGRSDKTGERDDLYYFDVINQILVERFNVDPYKIYVSGISSGGAMTLKLACDRTQNYAGYITVSANFSKALYRNCKPSGQRPFLAMSGTADKLMVFDGGQSDVGYLRRQGTDGVMSAYDTWDFWADNNGCNLQPLVQDLPDKEDDDTTVTAVVYEGCRGGSVIGFRINNGGHSWPGGKNYKGGLIGRLIGNTTQEIDASRILALIASSNGSADVIRAR